MIQPYETRAELSADDRNAMDDSDFAYVDKDGDRHLPIHDEPHVRAAIARFGATQFDSDDEKKAAAKKIAAAADKHGVQLDQKSDVSQAARSALSVLELRSGYRNVREVRRSGEFELRDADSGRTVRFTGYASVTESPYQVNLGPLGSFTETIARGAFRRSLGENADVQFLVNHNDLALPLARTKSGTMRLGEDTRGLHVEADFDPSNPAVQALRSAVDRKDADEMSFAFRVPDGGQTWSQDYSERRITMANLHRGDVSLVNAGSNPATAGTVDVRSFAGALREIRAGATLSAATMDTLHQVLSLVSGADENVDKAQIVLSELMGVPNPDIEQDKTLQRSQARTLSPAAAEFILGD